MDMKTAPRAEAAEIVLPAPDLDATMKFFADRLGFRLDAIFPADAPATALMSGHGLRLRLERGGAGAPARCASWRAIRRHWRALSPAAPRR